MQAAKDAVSKFTSNRAHRTEVDEVVNPAIVRETVKPHRHEEYTEAVDREVHQHHYHTTVQPVSHQERLAEKHTHNLAATENREIRHEDPDRVKATVAADLAAFKPSSTKVETTHSTSAAPTVTGEHVHHHVHETVIPVIHKETIQPEIVHTTKPIHEVHHAASQHHGISALPMKTLDDFKRTGGTFDGSKVHAHEEYDGCPKTYNKELQTTAEKLGFSNSTSGSNKLNTAVPAATTTNGISSTSPTSRNHARRPSNGLATAGAGAGLVGGTAAAAGTAPLGKTHEHRRKDSGVADVGRGRTGSSSSSASEFEYAADGSKVKKSKLGQLIDKVRSGSGSHSQQQAVNTTTTH